MRRLTAEERNDALTTDDEWLNIYKAQMCTGKYPGDEAVKEHRQKINTLRIQLMKELGGGLPKLQQECIKAGKVGTIQINFE